MLLLNAFSPNMLSIEDSMLVRFTKMSEVTAIELFHREPIESAVGHKATAKILTQKLGQEVRFNRATVRLGPGSKAVLAQYKGPRLDEGITELPDGARIEFLLAEIC